MQNSTLVLTFSVLDGKYCFLGKFGPKTQNCQFQLKFGTYYPGQNMWNKVEEPSKIGQDKKSFDIYSCLFFDYYCQTLISGRKTGHWAMFPPDFEIFPIYRNFLRLSLLNCVPCALKTCSRVNCLACLRAHVTTCLACLRAQVRMYLRAHVLTCLACLSVHLSTCLACLRTQLPTCIASSRANVPWLLTCLACQHALSPLPHTACVTA